MQAGSWFLVGHRLTVNLDPSSVFLSFTSVFSLTQYPSKPPGSIDCLCLWHKSYHKKKCLELNNLTFSLKGTSFVYQAIRPFTWNFKMLATQLCKTKRKTKCINFN